VLVAESTANYKSIPKCTLVHKGYQSGTSKTVAEMQIGREDVGDRHKPQKRILERCFIHLRQSNLTYRV